MTTEQKFNYIKNFSTCLLNYLRYALPIKDKTKEYPTMSDIIVADGYFVLDKNNCMLPPKLICNEFATYKDFLKIEMKIFEEYKNMQTINDMIDKTYNILIEFENKVKQLNGG